MTNHHAEMESHYAAGIKRQDDRTEIEQLRSALQQALRQWSMYAEMVERNDGFDLATEQSPEADMYRAAYALAHPGRR